MTSMNMWSLEPAVRRPAVKARRPLCRSRARWRGFVGLKSFLPYYGGLPSPPFEPCLSLLPVPRTHILTHAHKHSQTYLYQPSKIDDTHSFQHLHTPIHTYARTGRRERERARAYYPQSSSISLFFLAQNWFTSFSEFQNKNLVQFGLN